MENDNIVIEVEEIMAETEATETKVGLKAKLKNFVTKHKTKLAVAGTALVTTLVVTTVNRMNDSDQEEDEVFEYNYLPEPDVDYTDANYVDVDEVVEDDVHDDVNVEVDVPESVSEGEEA